MWKESGYDRLGYHEYQSIWDNPLTDGNLRCERETWNSHDPQAITVNCKRWSLVLQLQVVGHVPKKYLPINCNLFDIHVRLYRCVKIWMVKIWWIFGQSILPNFSGTKVSLHTVHGIHFMEVAWEITILMVPTFVEFYLLSSSDIGRRLLQYWNINTGPLL